MKTVLPLLIAVVLPAAAQVKVTQGDHRVNVQIDGKPFTELFYGDDVWKPFLHPLRAATGTIVTRHFPIDQGEGENTDHPHHRLWFGHGNVNGWDFWANEPSYKSTTLGKIVVKSIDELKSGDKQGTVRATFEWREPSGKVILTEHRVMTFYSDPTVRIIDFDITLDALTKVTFGDTKEGTFAMRLAAGLSYPQKKDPPAPPRTGTMVNSEGGVGEKACWGKRASWMDYYGELAGEKVGVAIFDHPSNPRHPTYWHTRAYGLYAANIFGVKDFTGDASQNGSMDIPEGQSVRFRYRVIVHPGDVKTANIAGRYDEYTRQSGQK